MGLLLGHFTAIALTVASGAPGALLPDSVMAPLRAQARALAPLAQTDLARRFLDAVAALPPPPVRTIYRDSVTWASYSDAQAHSLPAAVRARLAPRTVDSLYYYQARYGSILNYLRVIDLLGLNGITSVEGRRILDFGYGRVGHLRALAGLGA